VIWQFSCPLVTASRHRPQHQCHQCRRHRPPQSDVGPSQIGARQVRRRGSGVVSDQPNRVRPHQDGSLRGEIDMMNADGSGVAPLTRGGPGFAQPSWSPIGKSIAFVAYPSSSAPRYSAGSSMWPTPTGREFTM